MSKYGKYARRLDSAAKKIFEEIQKAETDFERAEQARRDHPVIRGGFVDADKAAAAARAEADYREAQTALYRARRDLPEKGERELREIRAELADAINRAYTIDPSKMDIATLELMKSGICKAADYEKLFADVDEENTTMIRLIASHAKKAYESALEARERGEGFDEKEAARLYAIGTQGQEVTEKNLLGAFDGLTHIYQRTMNNTAMIDSWEQLTSPIIENF